MNLRLVVALAACIVLAGCGTTKGPQATLTPTGPAQASPQSGLLSAFTASHAASHGNQPDATLARKFLDDGMSLVYANCSEFFTSAGETQQWILVGRDVVGTVGTIGSSVLALHNGSRNAVANLGLFTGLAFSGLDIYTKNFLFAAENIDSVRTLVTRALTEHQTTVLRLGSFTYQSAATHILDNQNYCSPASILALARQAIKRGEVTASVSGTGEASLRQAADAVVLQRLGSILNPPGPVTADQAGALWWLLKEFSSLNHRKFGIYPKLRDLPDPSQPLDSNGNMRPGWPDTPVRGELDKLSSETVEAFRAAIAKARPVADAAAAAAAAAAAPAVPGVAAAPGAAAPAAALPSFDLGTPASSRQGARVTVDIR